MTKIEWTDESWNPVVGCSVVSPGCTNCYAMKMAARLEKMMPIERRPGAELPHHYAALTKASNGGPVWTGRINKAPDRILIEPLRRKKPTRYFVNSMSDLFHANVSELWIDYIFAVMALSPQHTFQVLTKRSKRMREYLSNPNTPIRILDRMFGVADLAALEAARQGHARPYEARPQSVAFMDDPDAHWPLRNVWLGVSVEDQPRADERIPDLVETPAAVRFISAEPLLGPVDLRFVLNVAPHMRTEVHPRTLKPFGPTKFLGWIPSHSMSTGAPIKSKLDWVIVGGESGPGARPMEPDWARTLRDQCAGAGVPFFFKQWGAYVLGGKVGKKAAGRALDGVTHDAFPSRSTDTEAA